MSDQLNKMKYGQFVKQARGLGISEVSVTRAEKRDKVVLQYHGIAKSKQRINGEWAVPKGEKTADAVEAGVKEFLAKARKDFFVRRGEGLTGDAYKDAAQEVDVKPIVGEAEAGKS